MKKIVAAHFGPFFVVDFACPPFSFVRWILRRSDGRSARPNRLLNEIHPIVLQCRDACCPHTTIRPTCQIRTAVSVMPAAPMLDPQQRGEKLFEKMVDSQIRVSDVLVLNANPLGNHPRARRFHEAIAS